MKKILALTLACALTIGLLASCGGDTSQSGGTSTGGSQSSSGGGSVQPQDLVMGTGSSGGTYYALGGAMANAINNKLVDKGITLTTQATGASVENINLMSAGEMDLGIAMNNVAADAYAGTGAFSAPVTNVMAIGVVYNEVYQIVANSATTDAKNVEDLKGLKIAVGPAGSGTVGLSELIFAAAGLDINKDIEPQSDSFGDAATKMQDGHIDAACNTLAVPAASIQEMTATMDLTYINISDEILEALPDYFTRKVIEAGTYPKQTEDCYTVTCKAVLYCSADLDEDTVYEITKAYYTSKDEIAAAHETGKEIDVTTCLEGVTTPIHPGAARYFEELGMEVPDNG